MGLVNCSLLLGDLLLSDLLVRDLLLEDLLFSSPVLGISLDRFLELIL